ncbi:hypothetical protein BV25DRAFT_1816215 [Artomyces pyxidatus]|uniref:Uncharacterized protein n=1 Tax=Artomyces pyxidatus TaxID=48021 RepID=A0ACB8SEV8_9AGAM|nr:hypothetical protein BV25DRAFT_1816215 [Artomyces pyxidatus]
MEDEEARHLDREQRLDAEEDLRRDPTIIQRFTAGKAGAIVDAGAGSTYQSYSGKLKTGKGPKPNLWAPFSCKLEWDIVRWAKMRGPTSTAFTELLQIDGVLDRLELSFKTAAEMNELVDGQLPERPGFHCEEIEINGETYEVYFRDLMECVRALYGNPEFAHHMSYVPEQHFASEDMKNRMYGEMYTGDWWWQVQAVLENDKPGATIIPLIFSTDKTQLTVFRNRSAYPVYLTLGNISKDIRRKPSKQAQLLIGYLPTAKLEHITTLETRRRALANLFHACMGRIMEPIKQAGVEGVNVTGGDGVVRRGHPIFAVFVGDYPEQALVACVKYGVCPKCVVEHEDLGDSEGAPSRNLFDIMDALSQFDRGPAQYVEACQAAGIKPVVHPFWEDLPYANIFTSITPDILHQMYQGMMKHLISWVTDAFGADAIDARCQRMPPNHNLRLFSSGISHLSRVSGQEHKDICRILMGLVVDLPLPEGVSPTRLVRAVRAMLDFLYLAQYPSHSSDTLGYLDDALSRFHANKSVLELVGVRENFNFPKLHSLLHYAPSIRLFGTTDNYNTEASERLHIDYAKDAYRSTNHKDAYPQMTKWLERKEKVLAHEKFVGWRITEAERARNAHPVPSTAGTLVPARTSTAPASTTTPTALSHPRIHIARYPNVKSAKFKDLRDHYGAVDFEPALYNFIMQLRNPHITTRQLSRQHIEDKTLPFRSVAAYHNIKIWNRDPQEREQAPDTRDSVHVRPAYKDTRGRAVPGRFDTVLVDMGDGGESGVEGYRVAQVRAVFSLAIRARRAVLPDDVDAPRHMAYVEWFVPFQDAAEDNHEMYRLTRMLKDGRRVASVIPVANIRRSVHLFPKFGPVAPREWTSYNVLELCDVFYVNCFLDHHTYITVY